MCSLRPALRLTQTLQRRLPAAGATRAASRSQSPRRSPPRPWIFPARPHIAIPRRRFYSQQSQTNEQTKENSAEDKREQAEGDDSAKRYAREDTAPPPDPNKSPFQVFVDTFKSELARSRELQESIKAIQDESGRIGDSEALRKAKEAYTKAKEQSDRASTITGEAIKRAASTVGHAATATWDSPVVKSGRKVVSSTASTVAKAASTATEPIRQHEVYKTVSRNVTETLDDGSSSRYGGYRTREERRALRAKWEALRKSRSVEANPEAGESVVLHKDSAWREQWNTFKEENAAYQSLLGLKRNYYDESENTLVSGVRSATDWIADRWSGMFAENEVAGVIRKFTEMDPTFNVESFNMELREWIIPEIVDAYVKGDVETLRMWFSEAPLSVWEAGLKPSTEMGLRPDGQVLDIRGVDINSARILPQLDVPVFIVGFRTQEIHVYRDIKTGEIKAGVEDRIQQVTYAMVLTRIAEDIFDPETGGWKVIEFARVLTRDYV